MYFQNFASFNGAIKDAKKFIFYVELVGGTTPILSQVIGREGYPAAIEALANFHQNREPFMLWGADNTIVMIPYDQIRTIKLRVSTDI